MSAGALSAQSYYQDAKNPDILHHNERNERFRKELFMSANTDIHQTTHLEHYAFDRDPGAVCRI